MSHVYTHLKSIFFHFQNDPFIIYNIKKRQKPGFAVRFCLVLDQRRSVARVLAPFTALLLRGLPDS